LGGEEGVDSDNNHDDDDDNDDDEINEDEDMDDWEEEARGVTPLRRARPTQASYNKPDNWVERNRIGLERVKQQLQDCLNRQRMIKLSNWS
jgi:hypothetical protein